MNEEYINITSVDDIINLVKVADMCNFEIMVCDGELLMNARSIISLMSLNIKKAWKLSFIGKNRNLNKYINARKCRELVAAV